MCEYTVLSLNRGNYKLSTNLSQVHCIYYRMRQAFYPDYMYGIILDGMLWGGTYVDIKGVGPAPSPHQREVYPT